MSTQTLDRTFPGVPPKGAEETHDQPETLTGVQRLFVHHAYPPKLILDGLGFMWGTYLLWAGWWFQALVVAMALGLTGTVLASRIDTEALVHSPLGTFFLHASRPLSFTLQLIGYAFLIFGIWAHGGLYILLGISVVMLGHATGWKSVFAAKAR